MDYKEFSAKIKEKHPDYAEVDDRVLAEKMIAKYPDYKDSVTFDAPTAPVQEAAPSMGQKLMGMAKQAAPAVMAAVEPALGVAGAAAGAYNALRAGEQVGAPGRAVGDMVTEKLGNTRSAKAAGFVTSLALDPMNLVGGATGGGVVGKLAAETVAEKAGPKALKIFANVPEEATQVLLKTKDLFKQATGSEKAIEGSISRVQTALKDALAAEGKQIAAVEKKLGIARTADQIRQEMLAGEGIGSFESNLREMTSDKLLIAYQAAKSELKNASNGTGETIAKLRAFQQEMGSRIRNYKVSGDSAVGLLKATKSEIGQEIKAIPGGELIRAVQAKYARVRATYDSLSELLQDDGNAEQILQQVFKSDAPKYKTIRRSLAELEKISGKPVMTQMFQEFATKELKKWVGRPGVVGTALPTAMMSALNPVAAAISGTMAATQSPRVMSSLLSKAGTVGATAGVASGAAAGAGVSSLFEAARKRK